MNKKFTVWLLIAALLLTLTACATTKDPGDTEADASQTETDTADTPDTEPEAETPDEAPEEETPDVKPEEETPTETNPEEETPTETKPEEETPAETKPEEETPTETKPEEETPADTQPETPPAETGTSVDLSAVRADIISQLSIADPLNLETDALLNLYGIDASLVAQSASFVTMSGTFPDEVILVEAVDEAAAATIQEKLQNRLNEVLVQSESYDPDNYKAAQSCQVRVNGLYVSLILSPKQADMAAVYATYVG